VLVSAQEGYRLWAASYNEGLNPLLTLERRVLPDFFGAVDRRRVVDIACGAGRWMEWFANQGANTLGIDYCQEMLDRVPARLVGCVAIGNAESLPVGSGMADLTVCSFAASYFVGLERAIAEMARITKVGGRVIIADVHPEAIAKGWTRSFRAAGRVYEIEHFRYSVKDLMNGARRAGLRIAAQMDSHFDEPDRLIFERAGKLERFSEVAAVPAIWAGSWRKA
jgi:ubiquinone/menaquinone biosynthesis C-methylase UbiE